MTATQALARATDPETSALAAARHDASGARASHKARLLAEVLAEPGRTSTELGKAAGIDRVEAARRLADLRNDGLVTQGLKVRCSVAGNLQVSWWPVTRATQERLL